MKQEAICPKCGGPAQESAAERHYSKVDDHYWYDTLICTDCGEIWVEAYERVYIGYYYKNKYYSKVLERI